MTHTLISVSRVALIVALTEYVCGSNLSVWQTPRNITAVCGEHVNITCHFTLRMISTSHTEGWKVSWKKDNETSIKWYNISDLNSDTGSDVNKSHTLKLHAVSVNHSGVYYCTVLKNIPKLVQFTDTTGTRLIVVNKSHYPPISITPTLPVIWMGLLALALSIVCVMLVACCKHRGTKLQRDEQRSETVVIYTSTNRYNTGLIAGSTSDTTI